MARTVIVTALTLVLAAPVSTGSQPAAVHNDLFPAWSPDGTRLAFTSDRSGDPEIFVVGIDGTGLRQLTTTPGRDAHPSWSPDGTRIAFQSPRNEGQTRLFLMDADGSGQQQITPNTGFCGVPVWSPDGTTLAFQCSDTTTRLNTPEHPWRVYTMKLSEGRMTLRTHGPGHDQVPNWSPDGSRLVFYSDRSGVNQLYLVELQSGRVARITKGPGVARAASFSPDGTRIVFIGSEGTQLGDLFEIELASGARRRVTTLGIEHGLPLFSPDGSRILFQHRSERGSRIMVMDARGGAPREVNTSGDRQR